MGNYRVYAIFYGKRELFLNITAKRTMINWKRKTGKNKDCTIHFELIHIRYYVKHLFNKCGGECLLIKQALPVCQVQRNNHKLYYDTKNISDLQVVTINL